MSSFGQKFFELKTKDMSLEEKLELIKTNHLTEGCKGEYHGIRDIFCDYKFGCGYMMDFDDKQYCMKKFEKKYEQ